MTKIQKKLLKDLKEVSLSTMRDYVQEADDAWEDSFTDVTAGQTYEDFILYEAVRVLEGKYLITKVK